MSSKPFPETTFIIGAPRSGTTMFMHLVSSHDGFAWVSNWQNRAPRITPLSVFNRLYSTPLTPRRALLVRADHKWLPSPAEPWIFWTHYLSQFRRKPGDATPRGHGPEDMSSAEREGIRRAVAGVCSFHGRSQFLSKYTDYPRIAYLRTAFPDARFIHLVRDGRAVVSSALKKVSTGRWDWWRYAAWWSQGWPAAWREEWNAQHATPLGITAYQWKYFVTEIRREAAELPRDRYLEIQYQRLAADAEDVLDQVLAFCGLSMTDQVRDYLKHNAVRDMNHKWRTDLTHEQQQELDNIIFEPDLRRSFVGDDQR